MMWEAHCTRCGYVARASGLIECASWLWHHHAVSHPGLLDMQACKDAASTTDDTEPLGYPGTPSARQYVPAHRPAA